MRGNAICIALLASLLAIGTSPAQDAKKPPADGIYDIHEKGDGPKIKRNDNGATVVLGEKLTGHFGRPAIISYANDNSVNGIILHGAGPLPVGERKALVAVVIAGHCFLISSWSPPEADNTYTLSATIHGEATARAIAKIAGIEPKFRKHPGHKFFVTFEPDKKSYEPKEPITLTMAIKNIGETTVTFHDGGMQRGPRDNQFGFIAMRMGGFGKAVPDTGDPTNFGGIGSHRTLKPGETFKKTVRLDNWFQFENADTYRITGMYRLFFHEPNAQFHRAIWEDFAVGECTVRVQK
jgi:hypothetical protein